MALPAQIDPIRLASRGKTLHGRLDVARMARIAESLPHPHAEAEVRLRFYSDQDDHARVEGELRARLQVRCQRCLEPVLIEVRREVRLMPVASDAEAAAVHADYEPLLVEAGTVSLAELIEDELILSMPAYPCHPPGTCHAPAGATPGSPEADAPRADNPFEVLRSLKRDDTDEHD